MGNELCRYQTYNSGTCRFGCDKDRAPGQPCKPETKDCYVPNAD